MKTNSFRSIAISVVAVAVLVLAGFFNTGCVTMGGDPKVSLPQLESITPAQFDELCLHTEALVQDATTLAILNGVTGVHDVFELADFVQTEIVAGDLVMDPHLLTKLIKSDRPAGKAILSVVLLAEDYIRLHYDLGPVGNPLTPRARGFLASIVEGLRNGAIATGGIPTQASVTPSGPDAGTPAQSTTK